MTDSVLIIGAGPAGSASAMNLLKAGFQPIIIEAESFPRYHIGESLTTECVDALSRLGLEEQLSRLSAPRKQGVRIFSKHPENNFFVGAGDAWQVERARFDNMMMENALARGCEHIHGRVQRLAREDDGDWQMEIRLKDNSTMQRNARFVIDASGQERFSIKQGLLGPVQEGGYSRQIALFAQYENINKQAQDAYDTLIHHREINEWVWMIPLSETVYSVGLVLPVTNYKAGKLPMEEFLDKHLLSFTPALVERMKTAKRISEVRAIASYSYRIDHYAENGLFCVGDSHGFIDPIFSFGVEFAVIEAEYVGKFIVKCSQTDPAEWQRHADDYMRVTSAGQAVVEDMLSYFWAHPWGFANMAHVRYKEEFLEMFAGRVYEIEAGEGLRHMRSALNVGHATA
ncbi:MAG: tryptophan 7-halogenase [Candidatus Thiodiazotropha sp. (ex Lucinoma kastoroae)]|nr:tryptophan 7-halogenase [Candidatus Thiodiazotropha sp. (ex Rostrolucina anterorostrata)]MCU7849888.1 tryptophan 7-halogenase [Candidatus Thiodiazotropha sp. (ex Lucinoma kastoroae)]MCU7862121.1 tryptophan 7-halogenase [Candidatus Thiodiazotropha sp. (ex Lucinoma kastoroae)]